MEFSKYDWCIIHGKFCTIISNMTSILLCPDCLKENLVKMQEYNNSLDTKMIELEESI